VVSMSSAPTPSKLDQLRAKTDQELAQIIDHRLESALNLLDSPEPQRVRAEEAYVEAVKLLPKVEDQRVGRRLRIKLVQVRENLEHLQAAGGSRAHAAYR